MPLDHTTPNNTSLTSIFLLFFRLGITAFGGPAMIAHLKELAVKRQNWLDEQMFKQGVALCQLIPGATAMQMAAYIGLKIRGIRGAFMSFAGFGLPAFITMLILSACYAGSRYYPQSVSLFRGLQVIVVAIIAHAAFSFGRDTLNNSRDYTIGTASAVLLWYGMSPFSVIICAILTGMLCFREAPSQAAPARVKEHWLATQTHLILLLLPAAVIFALLYRIDPKLFSLAALMLKVDLFAFGGGFGSLPLMFHEVVKQRGWLDAGTFMDGIALGQVTPGPIVITSTFVGYLLQGVAGAIVATTAIFTPSFLLLVGITPVFDRFKSSRYFSGATRGILASFVGLLLYMTVKFSLAITWEFSKVVFVTAVICALFRKINLLLIVLLGSLISLVLF